MDELDISRKNIRKYQTKALAREAVKPMIEEIKKDQTELTKTLVEKVDKLIEKVEENKPIPIKEIRITNLEKELEKIAPRKEVSILNTVKAIISNLPVIQKIVGNVKIDNFPEVQKVLVENQVEIPEELTVKVKNPTPIKFPEVQRVFVENQVEMTAFGGQGGQKEWPLITITYDGANNPIRIVKEDGLKRITKDITYDGANNPIKFTEKYEAI